MQLSPIAQRVLGSLLEKSLTTPNAYPLSLAALQTACNQRSAREPVLDLDETDVQAGLRDLRDHDLVRTSPVRGRVAKHEHTVDRQLDLDIGAQTVLGVLLLRGPQTIGEIRTRTDRWHSFADLTEVEGTLTGLAQHPFLPLVEELPREPGRRESRWTHLLGDPATLVPGPNQTLPHAPGGGPGDEAAPAPSPTSRLAMLEDRVAALEARLGDIAEQLGIADDTDGTET